MIEKDKNSISKKIFIQYLKKQKKIGTMFHYLYCKQDFGTPFSHRTNLQVMNENLLFADKEKNMERKKILLVSVIGHMCTPICVNEKDYLYGIYCGWKKYINDNWVEIKRIYENNEENF